MNLHAYFHTHYFRNFGPRFVMNVISKLAGLIITIYLARFLGPTQLGYFSFVAAVAGTLTAIFSLGIPGYLQKHVAELVAKGKDVQAKMLLGAAYRVVIISATVAFISSISLGYFAQSFLHRASGLLLFALAGAYSLVLILDGYGEYSLIALHRLYLALRSAIIRDFLRVVLVILLAYLWRSFIPVVLIYVVIFGAYACFLMIVVRRYSKESKNYSFLRGALPYLFFGIASMLLAYTDVLMLSYFRPMSDVGYYKVAQLLITSTIAILPVVSVSLPTLSRAAALGKLRAIVIKLFALSLFLGGLADFILYFFGQLLITFFVGPQYLASISILHALLPLIPFYFTYALGVQTIIALDHEREQVAYPLLSGSLNVLLNYFLIQRYGAVGAAMATSASMGIAALLVLGRLLILMQSSKSVS